VTSVGISFIHTADWQIGKLFGTIPEEARALLARQRIETIKRIADLANDNDADAVLVAGDVFETIAVADDTIRRTVNALEAFRGPWVLLPGNHDAALAESPWTRMRRFGLPENVILATVPEPIGLANGRLTILPAPLQRRHEAVDLTAWFDAGPSGDGAVRVGLAHGSIAGFLPAEAEAQNPIAHDRAERARLDYLALGDWHGTLRIGPRTWYAGTPEPDRFKANDPGNALMVRIDAPGSAPAVEKVRVGRYDWRELHVAIHTTDDVAAIADAFKALGEPLDARVVSLTLEGAVDLATQLAVNETLEDLKARVHHLRVDDSLLIAEPSDDDLDRIDTLGFVRSAIDSLRAQAADHADADRETARLALQMLFMEHHRQDG
jgi:DNA repair exonuclease SbcCD nuclease subunit